jgi:hypothetical protein
MPAPTESPFCNACQHNQALVQKLVAEYLPDEDDAEYEKYEAAFDGYRAELEERWPQVCSECEGRVNDQIRRAGYTAKADHLRRVMDRCDQKRRSVRTSRQSWTLTAISLAKWTYLLGFTVQVLWHVFGSMMAADGQMSDDEGLRLDDFSWSLCVRQAIQVREVDEGCVRERSVTNVLMYALGADAVTLWWNPKLENKTNSITGRMRGLKSLWAIRSAVFVLRCTSLYCLQGTLLDHEVLPSYRNTHLCMLAIMALSLLLTWKVVRIEYQSPALFRQSVTDHPSSAKASPSRALKASYKPAHPSANAFDTMAHGFTSSFASGADDDPSTLSYPPSPTLSDTSFTTDATTPFGPKTTRPDDAMDWTPTSRRFAPIQPSIHPSPWSYNEEPSPSRLHPSSPHSLFSKPDTNPFRHKVPAAPRAPAQAAVNPWKRGVWDPPLQAATPNFFAEDQGQSSHKGLDGFGVPRNVKRDAELFASPKLKYDYYGTMKDTGLEDRFEETFNDLFAK